MKRGLAYLSLFTLILSLLALLRNFEYVSNISGIAWKRSGQQERGAFDPPDMLGEITESAPERAAVGRPSVTRPAVPRAASDKTISSAPSDADRLLVSLGGGNAREINMAGSTPLRFYYQNVSTGGGGGGGYTGSRRTDEEEEEERGGKVSSISVLLTSSSSANASKPTVVTNDNGNYSNSSMWNTTRATPRRADSQPPPPPQHRQPPHPVRDATPAIRSPPPPPVPQPGDGAARIPPSPAEAAAAGETGYRYNKVLLLSYQRSGSTVVGDVLFNRNKDVMYSYEPLDALYSSMYGTEPGWNVPADITITPFGELRIIPEFELNAVSDYLSNLLSCRFRSLPGEYFIHPFWYSFSNHTEATKPYVTCLRKNAVSYKALYFCQRHIIFMCGKRFGDARSRRNVCSNMLLPTRQTSRKLLYTHVRRGMGGGGHTGERLHDFALNYPRMMGSKRPLDGYKVCLSKYTSRAHACSGALLPDTCSARAVHAVKTVRATMASMEAILRAHPDFFLIHLVRDPRGVVSSRRKSGWSQGFYGRGKVRGLALSYCTTVMADVRHRRLLEARYPGRIHSVVLDRFFENPESHVRYIYKRLGFPVPADLRSYLNATIKAGVADKWKEKLSQIEINDITDECTELYKEIIR